MLFVTVKGQGLGFGIYGGSWRTECIDGFGSGFVAHGMHRHHPPSPGLSHESRGYVACARTAETCFCCVTL
jgi:hypothetical protein